MGTDGADPKAKLWEVITGKNMRATTVVAEINVANCFFPPLLQLSILLGHLNSMASGFHLSLFIAEGNEGTGGHTLSGVLL